MAHVCEEKLKLTLAAMEITLRLVNPQTLHRRVFPVTLGSDRAALSLCDDSIVSLGKSL